MSEVEQSRGVECAGKLPWVALSWLHEEALRTLAELNEQCLDLLWEQALAAPVRASAGLLGEFEAAWRELDAPSRRRAARCPFLLFDPGLSREGVLLRGHGPGVRDQERLDPGGAFFTVPRAIEVSRLVLVYAWHLARAETGAARLFLGLSPRCTQWVAGCTLLQVTRLAEREPRLLLPRWLGRLGVWRELMRAAASSQSAAMDRFCMRGLQLLAGDVLSEPAQ